MIRLQLWWMRISEVLPRILVVASVVVAALSVYGAHREIDRMRLAQRPTVSTTICYARADLVGGVWYKVDEVIQCATFQRVLEAEEATEGALPVIPSTGTIEVNEDGRAMATHDIPANSVISRDDFVVLPRVLFPVLMTGLEMPPGLYTRVLVYPIQSDETFVPFAEYPDARHLRIVGTCYAQWGDAGCLFLPASFSLLDDNDNIIRTFTNEEAIDYVASIARVTGKNWWITDYPSVYTKQPESIP